MTILDTIFATKHEEVARRSQARPLVEVRRLAETAAPALDFGAALRRSGQQAPLRLIAEIKHASPSKGVLVQDFQPLRQAAAYQAAGAAAISVLTDEPYFQGGLAVLTAVAGLAGHPPLLCKDFLYDPYQVYEARAAGADAVLLIAAALEAAQLDELQSLAHTLGMAALVEVHNQVELEKAFACRSAIVGINNRDLHTFQVNLETCLALRAGIPEGMLSVAESGIHSHADVTRLAQAGFDAMLVGERLMTAPDPASAIRELLQ
jgi:indole-3-glycerol phosphate synthase